VALGERREAMVPRRRTPGGVTKRRDKPVLVVVRPPSDLVIARVTAALEDVLRARAREQQRLAA
jgi:hypothetical protein